MPLDATLGGKDVPMADFRRFLPRVFRSPIRSSAFLLFGELPSLRGVKTLERTRGPHIPASAVPASWCEPREAGPQTPTARRANFERV